MQKLKNIIKSPYMILIIFAVKMTTYYVLIGINVFTTFALLQSLIVLITLFVILSESKLKRKRGVFLLLYIFFSIIMFADTMYYNYYNQTVSVKQLWQIKNVAKVPESFVATLIPASFLLIIDIPFIRLFFMKVSEKWERGEGIHISETKKKTYGLLVTAGVLLFAINPMNHAWTEKALGTDFFVNHISDICDSLSDTLLAKELPEKEIIDTLSSVEKPLHHRLNKIAEGKNLILIQVEALQNFVIGEEYNGQVLTPNLNQLLQGDTLYFDNFYTTIGKGNTVDAEFTTLNSLYPVIEREAYSLYESNTFNGLPWLLKGLNYETFAVHGYEEEFWNRKAAYPNQGIDKFYAKEELDDSDIIGLGISDESMFDQTIDILKKQTGNYFSFLITLTNHHPYVLDEELCEIELKKEHVGTKFGAYLQTVFYTDKAIGNFIEKLKKEGLYEDAVIALYGDHHGLNYKMDDNAKVVSEFIGRDYGYDEMLHVPMIIHMPDSGVNETISTLGGQIDTFPTIANLMGLAIEQPYVFGQDLVNAESGFIAFTAYLLDGSFAIDHVMFEISREGTFEGSRAWEIGTGRELDILEYRSYYEKGVSLKEASEQILNQDLIKKYADHKNPIILDKSNKNK